MWPLVIGFLKKNGIRPKIILLLFILHQSSFPILLTEFYIEIQPTREDAHKVVTWFRVKNVAFERKGCERPEIFFIDRSQ